MPCSKRLSTARQSEDLLPQLLTALLGYRSGDFSVRLPSDWTGVAGKIADAFNEACLSING
jgi:hypothetical protein